MSTLPPELAALSSATGDDEKRRALAVGVAAVALDGGTRADVAGGVVAGVAAAIVVEIIAAVVLWPIPERHFGAAVAFCALFPLAVRLLRGARFARVRRRFARDSFDESWRALEPALTAAWERASPGQRAALLMLAKKSA